MILLACNCFNFGCSEILYYSEDGEEIHHAQNDVPKISLVLRNKTAKAGSTAKFACRYQSKTKTRVEWRKNGKVLKRDLRYKLDNESDLSVLTIQNVAPSDVGEYSIIVKNDAGDSTCSASLSIDGKFFISV